MSEVVGAPPLTPNPVIDAGLAASQEQAASQHTILGFLAEIRKFPTVVEFGCDDASWLHAARRLGATEIRGYGNQERPNEVRGLTAEEFFPVDLSQIVKLEKTFALAICLEGARQVDESSAGNLIKTLCEASTWVLFGADIPYASGKRLPNERWVESWAKLFSDNGYVCYDVLRSRFWHDTRVAFNYRQGACLYVRKGAHYALKARGYYPSPCPPSLIHPEMFMQIAGGIPTHHDNTARLGAFYRSAGKSIDKGGAGMPNNAIPEPSAGLKDRKSPEEEPQSENTAFAGPDGDDKFRAHPTKADSATPVDTGIAQDDASR